MMMDWQELYGGYPEILDVLDYTRDASPAYFPRLDRLTSGWFWVNPFTWSS